MSINTSKALQALRALLLIAIMALVLFAIGLANADKSEAWLARGPLYQYPSIGGTFKYGFWNVKVRSYYFKNRCHGSTVILNGARKPSIRTRGGRWSIATKYAVQTPRADDRYYYWRC